MGTSMIRRLIDAWRAGAEVAELRDRAVTDAVMIESQAAHIRGVRAERDSARASLTQMTARFDQADAALRDARSLLTGSRHATNLTPCPICELIDRIDRLASPNERTTP